MSVGKSSISRISANGTSKKKATAAKSVEKVETAPVQEVKDAPVAPAKKPAAKKPVAKKASNSSAFKIYQVSDELPYYLL
jgi:hypothetical protein